MGKKDNRKKNKVAHEKKELKKKKIREKAKARRKAYDKETGTNVETRRPFIRWLREFRDVPTARLRPPRDYRPRPPPPPFVPLPLLPPQPPLPPMDFEEFGIDEPMEGGNIPNFANLNEIDGEFFLADISSDSGQSSVSELGPDEGWHDAAGNWHPFGGVPDAFLFGDDDDDWLAHDELEEIAAIVQQAEALLPPMVADFDDDSDESEDEALGGGPPGNPPPPI